MASDLAAALADLPGVASKLRQEHTRTPEGRCPICTAGPQGGHVVHPCGIYTLATAALVEIARRRSDG